MVSAAPEPQRVPPVSKNELALKLVTGIAGTSLLAAMAWQVVRAPLLSDLGVRAAEVMLANGITDGRAQWLSSNGWTWRVARLSGTADAATRERTRLAIADLTGVSDAIWEDTEASATAAPLPSIDPANRLSLAACQTRIAALLTAQPILFGASDATIDTQSIRQIDAVAQTVQRCPEARISIVDRSPSSGGNAIALALSQARADAVATAFQERGIASSNLTAAGSPRDAIAAGGAVDITLSPGRTPAAQETTR
jgi:outer membrane protein OmpA-like peptidoglycan-associated protein